MEFRALRRGEDDTGRRWRRWRKVEVTRARGRPRERWMESVKENLRGKRLEDDEYVEWNRVDWSDTLTLYRSDLIIALNILAFYEYFTVVIYGCLFNIAI